MVSACGASGEGAETSLAAALALVPDTPENREWVYVSDVAAAAEHGDWLAPDHPFAYSGTWGLGTWATVVQVRPEVLPDPAADGALAVTAGVAPNQVSRFDGVAAEALAAFLEDVDGERSDLADGTLLVRAPDMQGDPADELFPGALAYHSTSIWYDDSVVILSGRESLVRGAADPTGDTLAGSQEHLAAARCLGEVIGAVLTTQAPALLLGIGESVDADGGRAETLCLLPEGDAETLREQLETELTDGASASSGQPWRGLIDGVTVGVTDDGWVRVHGTSERNVPVFVNMLMTRDLEVILEGG